MKVALWCGGMMLAALATPAQAFIFLMMGASGNGAPSPPPTLQELPARNPDVPIRPGGLPAPFLLQQGGQTMPRLSPPAGPQVAQISNEELLRRLERLEEENRRLRQQQSTPQPPTGAGGTADLGSRLPMQTSPGWWVHLHTWNPRGELGQGPIRTMRYPNQRFNMAIGHDPNKRGGQRDEIYIYRFEAWLRVQQAGTYQVGATINCAWNHWCNYLLLIDGVQLADVQGDNSGVSNRLVFAGRHLEPGGLPGREDIPSDAEPVPQLPSDPGGSGADDPRARRHELPGTASGRGGRAGSS